ncbi:MAG: lipopolysaccharide biosynthesis protein RfbH [Thaumarchaeota archaeon]|nr:MAG: lipopolysaccharide biosynthesis protein RfbH [Nitrososphaerota archaeon]
MKTDNRLDESTENLLKVIEEYYENKDKNRTHVPGKDVIQHAGPYLRKEEFVASIKTLLNEWMVVGENGQEFENKFCELMGQPYGIVTNSGSSANLLMLAALKSKSTYNLKKAKVITPAFCFPTTLNPIIQNGFEPVFVDVNLGDYNIDVDAIEKVIDKDCKVLFFSHNFGTPANMKEIMKIVEEHDLILLEDNCDALRSQYDGKLTGSFGIMSSCSFYPAHHITLGEGGFVACSNENLARVVRSLRDWGRGCYCVGKKANESKTGTCGKRFSNWIDSMPNEIFDHKFVYGEIGYNLKPLDLQCAMGLEQIKRLDWFEESFILPKYNDPKKKINWFGFILTLKNTLKFNRHDICDFYENHKISTRTFFGGNTLLHPAYSDVIRYDEALVKYPNATKITTDAFILGVHPSIGHKQIEWIKNVTDEFFISKKLI